MNKRILLALAFASLLAVGQSQDIGAFLADQRLVQRQIGCILERGRCDTIGKQIKNLLPEALNNNCERCDPRQKKNAWKLIQFMQRSFPNEWNNIVRRYAGNNHNAF